MRNSSFEILRLILMLLIIIHHSIVHGLGLAELSSWSDSGLIIESNQMMSACILNCLCICSVNCFVIISGYFKIKNSPQKIISLLIILLLYSLILNVIPVALEGDYKKAIVYCLFLSHSQYWFVIDYLFLMLFTPMLNLAFEKLPVRYTNLMILGLIAVSCYFGWLWGHAANKNGYTLLQFILMYCVGRKIRIADISFSKIKSFTLYFVSALACGLLMWTFWSMGMNNLAWRMTFYNNPLIIISSIGLFLMFKGIHIENLFVNKVAKSSLGIYLFQSSILIGDLQYGFIKDIAMKDYILSLNLQNHSFFSLIWGVYV